MIERYTDHAANERTFLAWVRTAIAIMAFGFVVERFDLFLEITSKSLTGHSATIGGRLAGSIAGLLLFLLGGGVIVLATGRFRRTTKEIADARQHLRTESRTDLALAGLLVLMGAALFCYLIYTVVNRWS